MAEHGRVSWISRIALSAFIFFSADLLLAQAGKAWVPDWDLRTHRLKFRVKHPVYHHDLAPKVDVYDRWGPYSYRLYTNSLGGRDFTRRDVALKSDAPRIVIIGDSFTEGVGYEFQHTFAGMLQESLSREGVEVINLGVSSYAPSIYYRKLRYMIETVGLHFDVAVVFVDPGDVKNDGAWYGYDPESDRVLDRNGKPDGFNISDDHRGLGYWFSINSVLGKLGYTLADLWRHYRRSRNLGSADSITPTQDWSSAVNAQDVAWDWDDELMVAWGEEGIRASLDNMDRLLDLLLSRNVTLAVATYPWPGHIWRRADPSRQETIYREWCEKNGVPFINLFPAFRDAGEPEEVIARYFISGDSHWNVHGHRMVFEKVRDPIAVLVAD